MNATGPSILILPFSAASIVRAARLSFSELAIASRLGINSSPSRSDTHGSCVFR